VVVAVATPKPIPPITPAEKDRYKNIFVSAGTQGGFLDGENVKAIFLKANLPTETLAQIW
jgi:epidermal growth factor receptor substrate 15